MLVVSTKVDTWWWLAQYLRVYGDYLLDGYVEVDTCRGYGLCWSLVS